MQKVLLTGGAGFIGSHMADLLLARGYDLTIIDNLSFGRRALVPAGARLIELDICDRAGVSEVFKAGFDTVVHLAAIHFIPYCNQHPHLACRNNVEGTQNVFDAASASGTVRHLFTASTAAVYPDCPGPIAETTGIGPMDVYGMTKVANEQQAAILARQSGVQVSVGRFFNAVGGRETNPHLVPDILNRLKSSNSIEIGNTSPKRDYIDVRDMAAGVLAMLDGNTRSFETCNIGTGAVYNVREIANIIAKVHGAPINLVPSEKFIRKVERENLQADSSKLQRLFGWEPKYTILDSMRYAYDWYVGT